MDLHKESVPLIEFTSEIVLAFGGDGTVLHRAIQIQKDIPFLGINCGGIGHYMNLRKENVLKELPKILKGQYETEKKDRLAFSIDQKKASFYALNEVAIIPQISGRLLKFDLSINKEKHTKLAGDGILVYTPSGSTAHNKSGGGPRIHPNTKAYGITILDPFDKNTQPIIVPNTTETKIHGFIRNLPEVMIDGQEKIYEIKKEITIKKGKPITFIKKTQTNNTH
jgi:NAD+ kinase